MGTVVAVRESEINVTSAEFHLMILVFFETISLLISSQDGRIIDRLSVLSFQHTALQPHLISTRQHRHIVEHHRVRACIGKEQHTGMRIEQGLQLALSIL